MKPILFKGHNVVFGEGQPEYQPLPALRMPDGEVYTCWELTDQEIEDIVKNRHIFLKQLTFNNALQPILPLANLEDHLGFEL